MPPFAVQKAAFCIIKHHLLQGVNKPVENHVENTRTFHSPRTTSWPHVDFNTLITAK
jgi:hypothetical protein